MQSLKLLSSRQALADFAYFHDLMVAQYHLSDSNKWVCFGGSYSGALAAWMRQLYPGLVVGAVAASAPVLAELDYVEYVEVTAQSLATGGGCGFSVAGAIVSVCKQGVVWLEPQLPSELSALKGMLMGAG